LSTILEKIGHLDFNPLPLLQSPKAQTLGALYWPQMPERKPTAEHKIPVAGGDQIQVFENKPESWGDGQRIVVLVHGFTGSYQSSYITRMIRRLNGLGVFAVRVNMRGSNPSERLAKYPNHCGRSEDTREVIRFLAQKYPKSPVTQIGFSMGGNITLKMAGEDGGHPTGNLDSIIAISPPTDIAANAKKLESPEGKEVNERFVKQVMEILDQVHAKHPELGDHGLPRNLSLMQIDEQYTAPRSGFKNAMDYYQSTSSAPLIPSITIPTLILCSQDDPVVAIEGLPRFKSLPSIDLIMTRFGGHVGFLGPTQTALDFRWMDNLILRWIAKVLGVRGNNLS